MDGAARWASARYSRYADDLTFSPEADLSPSGALMQHEREFATLVAAIALDEGFRVNFRKTRRMGQGMRQHVCGIVVNEHPNVPRTEYDRLKAILTNCRRNGARSQNRERHRDFRAHLAGRVAWVRSISPGRGADARAGCTGRAKAGSMRM